MEAKDLAGSDSVAEQNQERDLDLVQRARGGDTQALEQLITKYRSQLRDRIARRVGENEADDVLQETLLCMWRDLPSQDDPGKFASWLRQIADARCIDWHRRNKRRRSEQAHGAVSAEDVLGCRAPSDDPVIRKEREELIRRDISGLPQKQAEVVRMYFLEGLKEEDIAERTGKPVNTVKSRKRLALGRLKGRMSEDKYFPGYVYQHLLRNKRSRRATKAPHLQRGRLFVRWSVRRLSSAWRSSVARCGLGSG